MFVSNLHVQEMKIAEFIEYRLESLSPTLGLANTKAVTMHALSDPVGLLYPLATMSTAFNVASAEPRLWPVIVILISSFLYLSTSFLTAIRTCVYDQGGRC